MKKLGWVKTLAICLGITSMAACSSGGDDGGSSFVLPTFTDIPAAPAGTTGEIKFKAPGTWQISSDAMWLDFSPVTGEAGDQTVTYTINYKGQNFSTNEVAHVTFTSMSQPAYFTITRQSKPREIAFKNGDDDPATTFPISKEENSGSSAIRTKAYITANFNWSIAEMPEWIVMEDDHLSGEAGVEKMIWITVDPLKIEDQPMSGKIMFKDPLASTAPVQGNGLTVTYSGADDSTIAIKGFETTYEVKFNYSATLQDKPSSGYYEFQVIAKEGFKPVLVQTTPTGAENVNTETFWAHVEKRGTRAVVPHTIYWITVDKNEDAEREVELYVLPKSIADLYDADPECIFTSGDDGKKVKEEYQHYYACKIMQASSGPGFVLGTSWGQGGTGAKLNKIKDADLIAQYGTNVIYEWIIDNGTEFNYLTLSGFDYKTYPTYDLQYDKEHNEVIDRHEPEPMDQINVYLLHCDWKKNETAEDKKIVAKLVQSKASVPPIPDESWETFGVLIITLKGTGSAQ